MIYDKKKRNFIIEIDVDDYKQKKRIDDKKKKKFHYWKR